MRYRIKHVTQYHYTDFVSLCHNQTYLSPRHTPHQRCLKSCIQVAPQPAWQYERMDNYGNRTSHFAVQFPHKILTVTAISEVEITPLDLNTSGHLAWESVRDSVFDDLSLEGIEARDFILDSPLITLSEATKADVREYALSSFPPQRPLWDGLLDLTHRIFADFQYDPMATTVVTPLEQVLLQRRGVCQDFAHLAIACLRSLGLSARYVSGYLETLPPPGQQKLQGADASHAWFAAYLPNIGWLDFDPTNDQQPNEQYITTAWGRDYGDVPPLKGLIFGGGDHQLSVAVDVERLPSNM